MEKWLQTTLALPGAFGNHTGLRSVLVSGIANRAVIAKEICAL
jgi:hypothetical protein